MDYTNNFDKLSTPMMVCSNDWKIVYKNRACKGLLPVPRCGNYINKYFLGDNSPLFPSANGGICRIEFDIKDSYKRALCFEYFGYAIILFPVLLEYEVFECENAKYYDAGAADILRSMISALADEEIVNEDRYHRLESAKRYIYGMLENNLAYSLLCSGDVPLYPVSKMYRLIKEKITSIVPKAGYRVQIELNGLDDSCDMLAVNAATVPIVFSNMLLFCLSVSKNKTCFASINASGDKIHNKIYFSVAKDLFGSRAGSTLEDFLYGKPAEYLNVLPFECMCNEFGWSVEYELEEMGAFNACLSFDVGVEHIDEFNSEAVLAKEKDCARSISMLIERMLYML